MKLFSVISSSIFQILSIFFVIGYLLGVLNLYFSDKNDYCVMTYMFEYPQFVRISLEENKEFPQYGLYAYSEGRFTEKARKMWFDGVPVLFLTGNSGSHMQARSIASIALRKSLSREYGFHFDFFTISYNEELSGLYGGVLESQTQFAAASVSRILSLYKSNKFTKTVPSSVILIGHSMGGVIAKRLLAYPSTINTTNIAITLASPLMAPVVNFDMILSDYYDKIDKEWDNIRSNTAMSQRKLVVSVGSGPRDVLVPAGLTSSSDSFINTLTTAIPGVWVTPDHVSMVWCKQLVMVINRFLFSIVDPMSNQITDNMSQVTSRARQYFQANRSMILDPDKNHNNASMMMDAFWYEDNRRVYQISRPEIDRMTYLMIRLVSYPQNRFVAIESVNVDDKDWIFACNANHVHQTYRYCKDATSLGPLGRWTGAATGFGKRKLATINLHSIMEHRHDWTHVIVKVSPTKKPIILNVDINDYASRQIRIQLPSEFSFSKRVVIPDTEPNSLYYELVLSGLDAVHQAYLLHVEPSGSCAASQYHVSAEMHVPWAPNHETYHYFTHLKRSPMKLRLFKSNPNVTSGKESEENVKITILLDPQCTFTISISQSWYHRLGQLARNYSPILLPYVCAVTLLAARGTLLALKKRGACASVHSALASDGVKPYYVLVFGRLASTFLVSVPILSLVCGGASWNNPELQSFSRSLLVLPVYMTALGVLNIAAAAVLAVMVFSSQIANRLLFRIVWRGGSGLAERITSGLQRVPALVSAALVCAAPVSCGAASLVAGAAFYAFMLSKMYEEYLEDYVYRLMSKVASRICRMFKAKPKENRFGKENNDKTDGVKAIENKIDDNNSEIENKESEFQNERYQEQEKEQENKEKEKDNDETKCGSEENHEVDDDLSNLNFHMMLFFLWMCVTIVNIPALLTWARNFKHSIVLKPDASYYTGLIMSACSTIVWQINGPKKDLKYYDAVCSLLFAMAVIVLTIGPYSLSIINYGITFVFTVITIQQIYDTADSITNSEQTKCLENGPKEQVADVSEHKDTDAKDERDNKPSEQNNSENDDEKCDVCNENRIYRVFKTLREKFSFTDDL